MIRTLPRPARKPRPERNGQNRAALVFRDFVRQLEKLDAAHPKPVRPGPVRGARA
ncbi:hypothetical protein [Microvirga pakistanensis]|uniref:hypothetical protein n=1 Tax=Microvirga pakistanensis TaxID=1682650 RepID=UPI00141B109D|nr:hypothetical protein [Microvirga pakistanensis]